MIKIYLIFSWYILLQLFSFCFHIFSKHRNGMLSESAVGDWTELHATVAAKCGATVVAMMAEMNNNEAVRKEAFPAAAILGRNGCKSPCNRAR